MNKALGLNTDNTHSQAQFICLPLPPGSLSLIQGVLVDLSGQSEPRHSKIDKWDPKAKQNKDLTS